MTRARRLQRLLERMGRNPPAGGRYVRPEELAALRQAIRGYALFRRLAEQYADEIIRRTRAARAPRLWCVRAQASAQNIPASRKQPRRRKKPPPSKLDA